MEEFAIKNYVHHNLTDILLKVSKIYPEIFTESIVSQELDLIKNYVNRIRFVGSTPCHTSTTTATIETKKETVECNKVINLSHLSVPKDIPIVNINNSNTDIDNISKRCIARVLSNQKQESQLPTDNTGCYGRQCKNVMAPDSEFCSIHKKHNPYGIFREEPSAEVKKIFEKKYRRVCENTE